MQVEYPADVDGFLAGGSAQGSQNLADLARQAMAQCPDTKLTLSGYSQGAQLVHNAAEMLSADTTAFVSSAVVSSAIQFLLNAEESYCGVWHGC